MICLHTVTSASIQPRKRPKKCAKIWQICQNCAVCGCCVAFASGRRARPPRSSFRRASRPPPTPRGRPGRLRVAPPWPREKRVFAHLQLRLYPLYELEHPYSLHSPPSADLKRLMPCGTLPMLTKELIVFSWYLTSPLSRLRHSWLHLACIILEIRLEGEQPTCLFHPINIYVHNQQL